MDFPRAGNADSYRYARRQWSLGDNPALKYHQLGAFDKALIALARTSAVLTAGPATLLRHDEANQVLAFERGGLLVVVNLHVNQSLTDYQLPVPAAGAWHLRLSTDETAFGGFARVAAAPPYDTLGGGGTAEAPALRLYLPSRVALVLGQ